MQYVPCNGYVIVRKDQKANQTASGIILTSTAGADNCTVLAISNIDTVAVGDTIMIRWANALKIDGDIYAVEAKEIVCKLFPDTV
jgi:co-chaperonin GroES (HSP10)